MQCSPKSHKAAGLEVDPEGRGSGREVVRIGGDDGRDASLVYLTTGVVLLNKRDTRKYCHQREWNPDGGHRVY